MSDNQKERCVCVCVCVGVGVGEVVERLVKKFQEEEKKRYKGSWVCRIEQWQAISEFEGRYPACIPRETLGRKNSGQKGQQGQMLLRVQDISGWKYHCI